MMNISSNMALGEEQHVSTKRQPVRMQELLGIPKSAGKKKNITDASENPRPQPVRIKDLLSPSSYTKSNTQRMSTISNTGNNVRRQLYNDHFGAQSSSQKSLKSSIRMSTINKTILGISAAAKNKEIAESLHRVGPSKSDGKINKTGDLGRERFKPERMKDFMKSWEMSQTVQPSARKFATPQERPTNVRRKLYSCLPSVPVTSSKLNTASEPSSNLQTQKTSSSDAKTIKSKVTRKSFLPPRNSIRDKYVNQRQNETIKEEPSYLDDNESKQINAAEIQNDENIDSNDENRLSRILRFESEDEDGICDLENLEKHAETSKTPANKIEELERSVFLKSHMNSTDMKESVHNSVNTFEEDKVHKTNDGLKIPRPSVIMGISGKGIQMDQETLTSGSEISSFTLSRPPLQELDTHSILQPRLDENSTSLEDLLGNTRCEGSESFYRENLPRDSFLTPAGKPENSFVNIERQTLSWMHGNLKLAVQSTEEHLFSMKLVLKAMEDVMKNYNDMEIKESYTKIEGCDILNPLPILISDVEQNDDKGLSPCPEEVESSVTNILPKICITKEESDCSDSKNDDHVNLENANEEDKENVCTNNDESGESKSETGQKKRRRSLRLLEKKAKTPKASNDSFSLLEEELNIIHDKTQTGLPRGGKKEKRLDPRSRSSIREYMALKSTMHLLNTPDTKGMPTPKGEKDTPLHRRATRRSLSRKVLSELEDLYAESPL